MVKFKCAAIIFKDTDTGNIVEMRGRRHHEILKSIRFIGRTDMYKKWHEHGFIISRYGYDAKFVNIEEATKIAKEQGINMIGSVLTSEDLW